MSNYFYSLRTRSPFYMASELKRATTRKRIREGTRPSHSRLLSRSTLAWLLATPSNGKLISYPDLTLSWPWEIWVRDKWTACSQATMFITWYFKNSYPCFHFLLLRSKSLPFLFPISWTTNSPQYRHWLPCIPVVYSICGICDRGVPVTQSEKGCSFKTGSRGRRRSSPHPLWSKTKWSRF